MNLRTASRGLGVAGGLLLLVAGTTPAAAFVGTKFWELIPAQGSYISKTTTMGNGCEISLYSSNNLDTAWTWLRGGSASVCVSAKTRHYYSNNGVSGFTETGWKVWAQTTKKEDLRYSYHWYKYNY